MAGLNDLKNELFHVRKAFVTFNVGWKYLYSKYILSRSITKFKYPFEKSVTCDNLSMHVLFGHKHLYMALWSIRSYYTVSECIGKLYIHSDGTLTDNDILILKKFFPEAVFIHPDEVPIKWSGEFEAHPAIKSFREKYRDNFFLTKLVDPYFVSDKKCLLFFDIDILWFKNPGLVCEQVSEGCPSSWMMENVFSDLNGEFNTVYFKDGSSLSPEYSRYNGGIMLFNRDNFNLDRMADYFSRIDMSRPESRHWVEQSGYAYNLDKLKVLPKEEYIIKGEVNERTVVKHYTGPRRVEFYAKGLPVFGKTI